MSALCPGQTLAQRFVLVRRLGEGGMAEAWLVHDTELDEHVVAKVVSPSASPDLVTLLRHECRQARRLVHPNIVRVFDFHRVDGTCFVTMEHVDGESIASLRGRAPLEIVEVVLPIADALAFAHRHGVVHRDLKASNVLCDASGRPRLLDFGISGLLDPGPGDTILSGGGSRGHVSPQQRAGSDPLPSDDIYSLGVLIHELVTARPPFTADPPGPPPAMVSSHAIPQRLQALVTRMLAATPEDRPSDMTEVRAELDAIRRERVSRGAADLAVDAPAQGVRLTPPPRAEKVAAIAPGERTTSMRGAGSGSRWVGWATALVVAILGLATVAALFWLPHWADALRGDALARPIAPSAPVSEPEPDRSDPRTEGSRTPAVAAAPAPAPEPVDSMEDPALDPAQEPVPEPVPSSGAETGPAAPQEDTAGFAVAMSAGLEAEERGDWEAARAAFSQAAAIRPGSPEVADAIVRVDLRHKLEIIAVHGDEAAQDEAAERWASAVGHYDAVLAFDPTVLFAQKGRERAGPRADLDQRLEFHIAHPDRLSADNVFEEASRVLAEAEQIEPAGPRLRAQIDALAGLLEVAGTPVPVHLESDEQTDVIVYKVGHLGRFSERRLTLRPGRYVVVGSRDGYRDVRLELVVVAGQPPGTLAVRCEEKI